jgi:hypothetical protein
VFELDHIAFAVADLESARADLRALGLTATAVGVCRWTARGRSHRARAISVVFATGYLDLVESADAAWPDNLRASPLFRRGIAPSGIVLASELLEESRAGLSARDLAVGASYEIDRELPGAVPAGIHYEIFPLREPSLPFAVIKDSAPGAMRTEAWLRHPSTATGVRRVHLLVPSLSEWRRGSELLFGARAGAAAALDPGASGTLDLGATGTLDLGATSVVAHAEPLGRYLKAAAELLPRDGRTRLLAIELSVADVTAVRTLLERSQVPAIDIDGGIGIEPSAGYGCGILFVSLDPM